MNWTTLSALVLFMGLTQSGQYKIERLLSIATNYSQVEKRLCCSSILIQSSPRFLAYPLCKQRIYAAFQSVPDTANAFIQSCMSTNTIRV